jgi:hypothetical protein
MDSQNFVSNLQEHYKCLCICTTFHMFQVKIKVLWICRLTHFGLQADYKNSVMIVTGILGMTKNLFCFTRICFATVFLMYFTM